MKTPMLTEEEQVRLGMLLARRASGLQALRVAIEKEKRESPERETYSWDVHALVKAVLRANRAIVDWNEATLVGRKTCDEADGFTVAPLISLNVNLLDPDDRERVFAWNMDGEEFLPYSSNYEWQFGHDPEPLLRADENKEYRDYLYALEHAARTGWPPLSRKQESTARRIIDELRKVEHFLEDAIQHGAPPRRAKQKRSQ